MCNMCAANTVKVLPNCLFKKKNGISCRSTVIKSDIYGIWLTYSYNSTFASFRAIQPLTSQIRWSLTWRIQIGHVLPSRKYGICFLRGTNWKPISFWWKRSLHITKGETDVFVTDTNLLYQHNVLWTHISLFS